MAMYCTNIEHVGVFINSTSDRSHIAYRYLYTEHIMGKYGTYIAHIQNIQIVYIRSIYVLLNIHD